MEKISKLLAAGSAAAHASSNMAGNSDFMAKWYHASASAYIGAHLAPTSPSCRSGHRGGYLREPDLLDSCWRNFATVSRRCVISPNPVWDQLTGLPGRRSDPSFVRVTTRTEV